MNEIWPTSKSNLTPRSPTEIKSESNKIVTRSQSKLKSINESEETAEEIEIQRNEDKPTSSNLSTPSLVIKNLATKFIKKTNTKMENNTTTLQLQQIIANILPEFNAKNQNNVTRFLSTADSLYESFKTNEEKEIFNSLIKSKLSDEVFNRIDNRNVKTYPELKKLLKDIYREVQTLEELEKNYSDIRQSYGESVRNFGFRLLEALEKYRKGYKYKYSIDKIDPTYEKHLQNNTVKIFKRGLNNIILKDKIATSTNADLESIVLETEVIEKMLVDTNGQPDNVQVKNETQNNNSTQNPNFLFKTTCNYCQKPGHTLSDCRIRIGSEMIARNKLNKFQLPQRQFQPQFDQQPNKWITSQPLHKPMKYCSYCKIPGHIFDECRNKFFQRRPQNNYQGNQNFQQRRNNFNGEQQYQQPNIQQQKPQMNYVPYQQQQNKLQNVNSAPHKRTNYAQGYSQPNSYQQRSNYPMNNPYSQNNYSQQQNRNQQQNYPPNYISDGNQQPPNKWTSPDNTNSNGQSQNMHELTNMLNKMKLNSLYTDEEPVSQDTNPENSNGSSQN